MKMEEYLKSDIAKIIDRPIRTIQYWTDQKLVIPDIEPSQGRGKARVYSKRNLIEFAMIVVMSSWSNVELASIDFILEALREGRDIFSPVETTFYDFYTNSEWGDKKELVFVQEIRFEPMFDAIANIEGAAAGNFYVIPRDKTEFTERYRQELSCRDVREGERTLKKSVIFLGGIKKIALKMLNIPE